MNSPRFQCSEAQKAFILQKLRQAGACAAGFAAAEPLSEPENAVFDSWLAAGRHAGMDYMERYADIRRDPRLLLDGASSVISAAFAYTSNSHHSPLFADYALGLDYHTVLRRVLKPVARFMEEAVPGSKTRICVDTAPIRERVWAVRAGVGYIGLNNLLIVPGVGSGVFLAEILWTASAGPSAPLAQTRCNACGACLKACPEGALGPDGTLDAYRCRSYLTIEHRGSLPRAIDLADAKIYGCDICRHACPEGCQGEPTVLSDFDPNPELMALTLADASSISDSDFSRIFAHSAVRRVKPEGLRRNALHALHHLPSSKGM